MQLCYRGGLKLISVLLLKQENTREGNTVKVKRGWEKIQDAPKYSCEVAKKKERLDGTKHLYMYAPTLPHMRTQRKEYIMCALSKVRKSQCNW